MKKILMNRHKQHLVRSLLVLITVLLTANVSLAQQNGCGVVQDLLFTNGKIHTMDTQNRIVGSVHIIGNRIAAVGTGKAGTSECTQTINLHGKTVVPGLIDIHNHIILLGLRPGHDTRLENDRSITDVLNTLSARAKTLPRGAWITAIGGFDINQFTPPPAKPRFPTLAELDSVTPDNPVYIQESFSGPGVTNSLGKRFFESKGIKIGANGELAGGFKTPNPSTRALYELNKLRTFADEKRGTLEALHYAVSLGITTQLDEGAFPATGTASDGAASADPSTYYKPVLALHAEGKLPNRLRVNFLYMETDPRTPLLQARLSNAFQFFGDDMLRVVGIGEFTAGASPIIMQRTKVWMDGTRRVAKAGWHNENHSLTKTDFATIIDGWEQVNAELPKPGITKLRWVVAHVPFITQEYAKKLMQLGGGVNVLGGWRYISGNKQNNGPPFRMLLNSGIHMGMSSDGMQISPMNPWLGLYYVVTGRNARGELINAGQTLNRDEAIHLYTAANGWFLREEDKLGTIEPGKYADLVVLSADYFDGKAVPDEVIKDLHSILTVVGGKVVYGDPDSL